LVSAAAWRHTTYIAAHRFLVLKSPSISVF
jgi:hypothetical protein